MGIFNPDILRDKTALRDAASKLGAGLNTVPDWTENMPVGISATGVPFFDSVTFSLVDLSTDTFYGPSFQGVIGQYINSKISVNNDATVSRTLINGRKGGSVKQLIAQDDYLITFDITIMAEYSAMFHNADNTLYKNNGLTGLTMPSYGNYYPNGEMQKIMSFFKTFYEDITYQHVWVKSNYLNSVFGITKIIPYSINTQQDHEVTNSYKITINAYSEFNSEDIADSIIPKESINNA